MFVLLCGCFVGGGVERDRTRGSASAVGLAPAAADEAASATTDLIDAAERGDAREVERLLAAGRDPNLAGPDGVTALHVAASRGHLEVARTLLAGGAHVDQMEFDGDTALVNASVFGHEAIVALLLERGADASIESSQGFSPIQHARRERHSGIVRLLRDAAREPRPRATAGASAASGTPTRIRPPSASGATRATPRPRASKRYSPGYERRIAAVIGVNDYRHWPKLSGARADAKKMAERLRALGFDDVLELYDGDATRRGILNLLGSRLSAVVGENDLVVIFFAGHGQTETIEGGRKRGYIIPVDATIESVFATAIPMQQLREVTDRLPAKHVYYAMDSCYSGLGFTRGISVVAPGSEKYIDKVTSLRAVQMVTAGGEGEEAIERNGEGVFTRSLLDALDGRADANGDGYVTATEIGAYVAPRVTNETGARQSPQVGRLEGEGEIAFRLRPR